jgi:hypothetical protein
MSERSHAKDILPREISLSDGFGEVAVNAKGIRIELHEDGSVDAYSAGAVRVHQAAKDGAVTAATFQIGSIGVTGEHKGEIFGGVYPADSKPIWFLVAPRLMDHFDAAIWANEQGGALPTSKHGYYLMTLKGNRGAFAELFNRGGSFPAGYVWLAEPSIHNSDLAWCQRLREGDRYTVDRNHELPVLCVFR